MIEWVMGVVDRIEEEARRDPEYREFMEHQVELVPAFDALLQRLSGDDRELILESGIYGNGHEPPVPILPNRMAVRKKASSNEAPVGRGQ